MFLIEYFSGSLSLSIGKLDLFVSLIPYFFILNIFKERSTFVGVHKAAFFWSFV